MTRKIERLGLSLDHRPITLEPIELNGVHGWALVKEPMRAGEQPERVVGLSDAMVEKLHQALKGTH